MPRSGTTLIEQIISNNDFTYAGGEITILPKLLDEVVRKRINGNSSSEIDNFGLLENLRNLYYGYLDTKTDKEYIIDKMPYNFIYAGIIKLAFPEAKFIHVKRNINDNCLSIYKNYFSNNSQPFAYKFENIQKYYQLYKLQTEFWKKEFSEKIYQIEYENLIQNTKSEIMNLIEFCKFIWNENYIEFYKNKRSIYTASSSQVRSRIYNSSINSWKNYSEFF